MLKNDIDEFLRACNEAIDQLMKKMENVNQEKIDNVSTDLLANILITLLENDIVTSETYTLEREKERKEEGDLEARSKLAIKKLAQQVLEKEQEIKKLKTKLSEFQPAEDKNLEDGIQIHRF